MDHLRYVSKKTTIQYYDDHADVFVKGTISAEMSEARQRFLMQVP